MKRKGVRQLYASIQERYRNASEETKAAVDSVRSHYQAAKRFRKDKAAQRWFNRRCKGHDLMEADSIISKGIEDKEITPEQGAMIMEVLGFAGQKAFGGKEE